MVQRLRDCIGHVDRATPTASSVAQFAANLHILIKNDDAHHPDDRALISQLANVRLRETTISGRTGSITNRNNATIRTPPLVLRH
jgi:hypothetical protein